MRLVVRYRAKYAYDAPASLSTLSTHVLQIFPRPWLHLTVLLAESLR